MAPRDAITQLDERRKQSAEGIEITILWSQRFTTSHGRALIGHPDQLGAVQRVGLHHNARQRKTAADSRVAPSTVLLTSPDTRRLPRKRGLLAYRTPGVPQRQTGWRREMDSKLPVREAANPLLGAIARCTGTAGSIGARTKTSARQLTATCPTRIGTQGIRGCLGAELTVLPSPPICGISSGLDFVAGNSNVFQYSIVELLPTRCKTPDPAFAHSFRPFGYDRSD